MDISSRWFGLIVAYLVPGFIGLAGVSPWIPMVADWLRPVSWGDWGIGPTVYALLAATGVGMMASCVRWLVIDHLHQWMGVKPPAWNDWLLEQRLEAFNYLVENHYRYYQFYANTIIAVSSNYVLNRLLGLSPLLGIGTDLAMFFLCAVLFSGSRNALQQYYAGTSRLLSQFAEKGIVGDAMTNGRHHPDDGSTATSPRPAVKASDRPATSPKSQPLPAQPKPASDPNRPSSK